MPRPRRPTRRRPTSKLRTIPYCQCRALRTIVSQYPARSQAPRPTQPVQAGMCTWQKLGSKQAYRVIHQPVFVVSQCSLDAWLSDRLAEISADLREAVAHLRLDATKRYTNTPLHYLTLHLGKGNYNFTCFGK